MHVIFFTKSNATVQLLGILLRLLVPGTFIILKTTKLTDLAVFMNPSRYDKDIHALSGIQTHDLSAQNTKLRAALSLRPAVSDYLKVIS
jgi:hypothetical protein